MAGGLQFLAERGQRVAVARSGGIWREFEGLADLFESELIPDLEHEDLALAGGQALQRGFDLMAPIGALSGLGLKSVFTFFESTIGLLLAGRATGVTAGMVQRGAADRCDKEGLRIARQVPLVAPIAHEGFLDHILGIGERTGPLAGAQKQLGAVGFEPMFPGAVIMC